jgi:TfoX/Sxy family transcriptional regulator of competence genes
MAIDEDLAARAREAMTEQALRRGFTLAEKRMFGGLAFMLNSKMACGVINDELMVRVGPAAHDDALAREHARPMDFTGKPMRGYVFIASDGCRTPTEVTYWADRAADNIAGLLRPAPDRGELST